MTKNWRKTLWTTMKNVWRNEDYGRALKKATGSGEEIKRLAVDALRKALKDAFQELKGIKPICAFSYVLSHNSHDSVYNVKKRVSFRAEDIPPAVMLAAGLCIDKEK